MAFKFNNVDVQNVVFNGVECDEVFFNGVKVWEAWKLAILVNFSSDTDITLRKINDIASIETKNATRGFIVGWSLPTQANKKQTVRIEYFQKNVTRIYRLNTYRFYSNVKIYSNGILKKASYKTQYWFNYESIENTKMVIEYDFTANYTSENVELRFSVPYGRAMWSKITDVVVKIK